MMCAFHQLLPNIMRPLIHSLCCALLLSACVSAASTADNADSGTGKAIYGWVEPITIGTQALPLLAKLDTGATTSSLSAEAISEFERDKDDHWVRFTVRDHKNRPVVFEAPLVRHVRIRRHGSTPQRRPVVKLGMCVGTVYRERQFTLTDREGFVYPVLVGRNYLEGRILVDSARKKTTQPHCTHPRPQHDSAEETAEDLEEE